MRQKDPESRTLARWPPEKNHRTPSNMKQSDMNTLGDIIEGFSKVR